MWNRWLFSDVLIIFGGDCEEQEPGKWPAWPRLKEKVHNGTGSCSLVNSRKAGIVRGKDIAQ